MYFSDLLKVKIVRYLVTYVIIFYMGSASEQLKHLRTKKEIYKVPTSQTDRANALAAQTSLDINRDKIHQDIERRKKVTSETNILEELKDIEKQECLGFRKHAIVENYDDGYETIILAWGKHFGIYDNKIQPEKTLSGLLGGYTELNYSYIRIGIDPNTSSLTIGNEDVISADIWRTNQDAISNALVKNFLNPMTGYLPRDYTPDPH